MDFHTLREQIETIREMTGRESDDLITLSIPPSQPLETAREQVEEDHAEAEYIADDSRQFRRNALENLRRILR